MTDDVVERLEVAVEQLQHVRRASEGTGQAYRLDLAIQAVRDAVGLLTKERVKRERQASETDQGELPVPLIWERPRMQQKFEARLTRDRRVRLDGRGSFTPSGACAALVPGNWNGWREWKYWDEGEQDWRPIGELREAGYFN